MARPGTIAQLAWLEEPNYGRPTSIATTVWVHWQGGAFAFNDLADANETVTRWVGGVVGIARPTPTKIIVNGPRGEAIINVNA